MMSPVPTPPDETHAKVALKVLVIGPDQTRLAAVSSRLSALGFNCDVALSSPAALRGGLLHAPDVVVAIEVAGGWQPVRRLLDSDLALMQTAAPPVLVISDGVASAERADALASSTSGLFDWVEISAADREIAGRLMRLARLGEMAGELEELRRRCSQLETTDRLTGLPNHRAFQEFLSAEFRRSERYSSPLSLILIDIDRFRSLNDTRGHLWGDRLLQAIARGLRSIVREVDMAARYGGEQFALLLPETDAKAALAISLRVRAMVEEVGSRLCQEAAASAYAEAPVRVTVSVGVATWPDEGCATRGLLLSGAESALCRAKDEGRNRTIVHSVGAETGVPPSTGKTGGAKTRGGGGSGWSA